MFFIRKNSLFLEKIKLNSVFSEIGVFEVSLLLIRTRIIAIINKIIPDTKNLKKNNHKNGNFIK